MAQKKKRNYRNKQSHNNGNRDQGNSGPTPDISNAKPLDNGQEMHLTELKQKQIGELIELADQMGIEGVARSRKQDVIFAILKAHAKGGEDIYGDGTLEILQEEEKEEIINKETLVEVSLLRIGKCTEQIETWKRIGKRNRSMQQQ